MKRERTEYMRAYDEARSESRKEYRREYNAANSEKQIEYQRWYREANPDKTHSTHIRRHYGLTPEEYAAMLGRQRGGCAVCGAKRSANGKKLSVDHCHSTGRTRGLLCNNCNTTLGLAKESVPILLGLVEYLKGHRVAAA